MLTLLRMLTIDCTASGAPWWQTFPLYKSHDNRRIFFQWERLLRLEDQRAIRFFSEHRLRPLIQIEDPERQVREFEEMLAQIPQ